MQPVVKMNICRASVNIPQKQVHVRIKPLRQSFNSLCNNMIRYTPERLNVNSPVYPAPDVTSYFRRNHPPLPELMRQVYDLRGLCCLRKYRFSRQTVEAKIRHNLFHPPYAYIHIPQKQRIQGMPQSPVPQPSIFTIYRRINKVLHQEIRHRRRMYHNLPLPQPVGNPELRISVVFHINLAE
jgi:hypothetical protein